jgi:hypothetical protein
VRGLDEFDDGDHVFGFFALRGEQRWAARASSSATGACSVSSNVAALLLKTVISRANQ